MATDERIDALIEVLEEHVGSENCDLHDIKQAQQEHGELLARLDERTQQYEKRMDRMDKKAAGLGAVSGVVGGFLAVLGKSLFGPPGA